MCWVQLVGLFTFLIIYRLGRLWASSTTFRSQENVAFSHNPLISTKKEDMKCYSMKGVLIRSLISQNLLPELMNTGFLLGSLFKSLTKVWIIHEVYPLLTQLVLKWRILWFSGSCMHRQFLFFWIDINPSWHHELNTSRMYHRFQNAIGTINMKAWKVICKW